MVSSFCQAKKLKKVFGAVFLCERGSIFGGGKESFLGRLWTAKGRQRERSSALHRFACQLLIADLLAKRAKRRGVWFCQFAGVSAASTGCAKDSNGKTCRFGEIYSWEEGHCSIYLHERALNADDLGWIAN